MTATQAQIRHIRMAMDAMRQHAPQGALKALSPQERGVVLADWLTQHVKLNAAELEHLGNYLCQLAWAMDREGGHQIDREGRR